MFLGRSAQVEMIHPSSIHGSFVFRVVARVLAVLAAQVVEGTESMSFDTVGIRSSSLLVPAISFIQVPALVPIAGTESQLLRPYTSADDRR
jgi:hypothetical protein